MDEEIQCGGDGQRFTVEVSQLSQDGLYRLYVVGHLEAADACDKSEQIEFNGHSYSVRPAQVLELAEAMDLFHHYYDHNCIPDGWHLRERPEFTREIERTD